ASATDADGLIAQHLAAGTYFLEVQGLGSTTGAYTLSTQFLAATPPFRPLPAAGGTGLVSADFNGDGIRDLATADWNNLFVSVLLGVGDGTFQAERRFSTGTVSGLAAGDFNGDGVLDLVASDFQTKEVSVLLGRGDGTFQNEVRSPTGGFP